MKSSDRIWYDAPSSDVKPEPIAIYASLYASSGYAQRWRARHPEMLNVRERVAAELGFLEENFGRMYAESL